MKEKFNRVFIESISYTTEDGLRVTIMPEMALCNFNEDDDIVEMQIPVMYDDAVTHIVVTDQEMRAWQRSAVVRESLRAVNRARRDAARG